MAYANISSFKELVEALAVLLESTANALRVLNAHQSRHHHEYVELCKRQRVEEIESEASLDSSKEGFKTVEDK